jgi:hypothetical protein
MVAMGRMVRKQVYIERHQEALLKRRARELGITEAALIRRGIELVAGSPLPPWQDLAAWAEARALMERRKEIAAPQTGRGWSRNELYDP